jgi:hypothetical protein
MNEIDYDEELNSPLENNVPIMERKRTKFKSHSLKSSISLLYISSICPDYY